MARGVTRHEVRHGRVRGTLFLPNSGNYWRKENRQRPCVITIQGDVRKGKIGEDMAALMASR